MTAYPLHADLFNDLVGVLKEIQGGRCGICGATGGELDVDHDHTTGMVRGLLCRGCNLSEGRHGGQCQEARECDYCLWRQFPAVIHVGWTTNHSTSMDVIDLFRLKGFTPTSVVAERKAEQNAKLRDRLNLLATERRVS